MVAVQVEEEFASTEAARPVLLRVVRGERGERVVVHGPSLASRRVGRACRRRRRQRIAVALVLAGALTVLAIPGHGWGATTGAGLSTDLAASSVLASGEVYVVQPGDTIESIAREMNPVDPTIARSLLERELRSGVVVAGEHVLIP